jgi:CubicO group peptidase (beta-lactamase class C family)
MDALIPPSIPGGVLGILHPDGHRTLHAEGLAQREPNEIPMREDTIFDLASLTKVIFTTPAILKHVEADRIALDDTLATVVPDLRQYDPSAAERRLTFRQCLAHQTHLPAVEPLYTYGQTPQTLRAFILQRQWRPGPPVYSDLNFILLGIALERLTGLPLTDHTPPPGFSFHPNPAECAATERCTWRGRVLRGEVHDENAAALQGAGHAGLFGPAAALLDFAASLLDGTLLRPATIATMRTPHSATRALGWEIAHPGWSGGDACSAETLGHTGFTGTGLWIDFAANRAWTLLTNRVHPSRHTDSGIATLRKRVGERVSTGDLT